MYAIERFGTIELSPFNNSFTLSPVETAPALIQTAGGVFDNDGEGRSKQIFPHPLSYKCVVAEDVYDDNRDVLDALRAAVGTRARLYRRARDDNDRHFCMAKLPRMPHDWPYQQRGYFEIEMAFLQLTPWQGSDHAEWRLDDGEVFDDGLELDPADYIVSLASFDSQIVTNGGNLPVRDVILTVTAGASALSNPVFQGPSGVRLAWNGTIPAFSELVIDCGARSVMLAGADAYDTRLTLAVGHSVEDWFYLDPGATLVSVAILGTRTGATWGVTFRDWWA